MSVENRLQEIVSRARDWLDINSILNALGKEERPAKYGTIKAALLRMAAEGKILSRKVGSTRRGSWLFMSATKGRAEELVAVTDPFRLAPDEKDRLTITEIVRLYDILQKNHLDLIRRSFERTGARYIVLCDGKLLSSSDQPTGPSQDEIRSLERATGKACYVIGADVIEEAPWSKLGGNDFYPTLPIHVGPDAWNDRKLFDEGIKIISDFDTGNPDVAAFDVEALEKVGVPSPVPSEVRSDLHLGSWFYYAWRELRVGVEEGPDRRSILKMCKCVIDWSKRESNPLLLANPERTGFVGRDLLLGFPLIVSLNGSKKSTELKLG